MSDGRVPGGRRRQSGRLGLPDDDPLSDRFDPPPPEAFQALLAERREARRLEQADMDAADTRRAQQVTEEIAEAQRQSAEHARRYRQEHQ